MGENDWLFYRPELAEAADAQSTDKSLDLIQRFGKIFAADGVELAVTMVPINIRIYAENLLDDTLAFQPIKAHGSAWKAICATTPSRAKPPSC